MAGHLSRAKKNSGTFKKGSKKPPGSGRKKGQTNQVCNDVRVMIKLMAERNIHKVESWLERTAKKRPDKATDLFLRLIEYHIPKLTRTEHTVPPSEAPLAELPVDPLEAQRVYMDYMNKMRPVIDHPPQEAASALPAPTPVEQDAAA